MEELHRKYFVRARKPYPTDLLAKETRLVALLPGKWNDDVRCELFRVSKGSEIKVPRYQALSYAWGVPGRRSSRVYVNGCEFEVTVNLGTALRLLRDRHEPVILWIDALCINQQNDYERSTQVAKMRNIYAEADQVIIFLGDDSGSTEGKRLRRQDPGPCAAFTGEKSDEELIRQCLQNWVALPSATQVSGLDIFCLIAILTRPVDQGGSLKTLQGIPPRRLTAIFEGLRAMLTVRWWDRMWVVQEAVVAESMVVRYGNASMPWKMLAAVASLYYQGVLSNYTRSISSDDTKVLQLLSRVMDLDYFRQTWRERTEDLDLLSLLRQLSNRKSSDNRDKIFALLGLCSQSQTLAPDYSWDEVTVYVKYIVSIIQNKRSLTPLSGDIGRKNRQDMPSWVPDWSATFDDYDRGRQDLVDLYDACGGVGCTMWMVKQSRKRGVAASFFGPRPFKSSSVAEYSEYQAVLDKHRGRCCWKGWDCDKAFEQVADGMKQLLKSLEGESQPEEYLPRYVGDALQKYKFRLKILPGDSEILQDMCDKLIPLCHPKGQRSFTRFVNHSLLTLGYKNQDDGTNGRLVVRGRYLGTVARRFEPLYSCSDTEAVREATGYWYNEIFPHHAHHDKEYDLCTAFAATLLSDAKITKDGAERLGVHDNAHLTSWLWRVVWKAKPVEGVADKWLSQASTPNTDNLPDDQVLESYAAAMRVSLTKRAFFITKHGMIGLGPPSIQESDEIYTLPGGKMPFILRKRQLNPMKQSTFSLIGECYVDACMDGQMRLPNHGGIPEHCLDLDQAVVRQLDLQADKMQSQDEPRTKRLYII